MKKIFPVFLSLCIFLTGVVICPCAGYAFRASGWAVESIEIANACGIIPRSIYAEDYAKAVTRENVAEMVVRAYENVRGDIRYEQFPFSDVYDNEYIHKICTLGIMNGRNGEFFSPYDNVTREEMAKIVLGFKAAVEGESLILPVNPQTGFSDFDSVSEWAKPYVAYAKSTGIFTGYDDNTFRSRASVSAEMAIALILRCTSLNRKDKPAVTTLYDGCVVPSGSALNVGVSSNGEFGLYLKEKKAYSSLRFIGKYQSGMCKIDGYHLAENSAYDLYVECDGVFSDIINFYTDSVSLVFDVTETETPGTYRISWNPIAGTDVYTLKVTECRNSYYPEDIPPRETDVYSFRWEDYIDLNLNPDRTYTIEISGGQYSNSVQMRIPAVRTPEHDTISASYPQTKEEADALMTSVSVPVWRLKNGQKVAGTAYLTVHRAIADKVKLVFEEIYNGPEKFPIKDVGAYSWRGGRSEHNGGTAIDINANENYCIYQNGTVIGSYWKPYEDVYSITPYGDVVRAFEKYGFTWGGDAWRNPKDYMHFSYLGT